MLCASWASSLLDTFLETRGRRASSHKGPRSLWEAARRKRAGVVGQILRDIDSQPAMEASRSGPQSMPIGAFMVNPIHVTVPTWLRASSLA